VLRREDVTPSLRVAFDRGTLRVEGSAASASSLVRYDARTEFFRAPAYHYTRLAAECQAKRVVIDDHVASQAFAAPRSLQHPALRPYQQQAVDAFETLGRRGVVALPTGSGKTRVACAAIARAGTSAVVLVPTPTIVT